MRVAGIYKIQRSGTNKVYVGSAVNLHRRFRTHKALLVKGQHHSQKLQRAWSKHGAEVFQFSVLELVPDHAKLIEREQAWIDLLDAVAHYNILPKAGSPLGRVLSVETRAKISAIHKGKKRGPWTPEQREAIMSGVKPWRHTEESLKKMRAAQAGRTVSEAARANIAAASKRRAGPTEATKAKLSEAGKGRIVSDETKAKIAAAHAGKKRGPMSEEAKLQRSMMMLGKKWTAEQIARRNETKRIKREARSAGMSAECLKSPPTDPAGRAQDGQSFAE